MLYYARCYALVMHNSATFDILKFRRLFIIIINVHPRRRFYVVYYVHKNVTEFFKRIGTPSLIFAFSFRRCINSLVVLCSWLRAINYNMNRRFIYIIIITPSSFDRKRMWFVVIIIIVIVVVALFINTRTRQA